MFSIQDGVTKKQVQRKINMKEPGEMGTVEFTILNMCYGYPCTEGVRNLSKMMLKQMLTLDYHIHAWQL